MDITKNINDKVSFQCKYHHSYDPQYLLLNSEEENIILCNDCLDEPQYSNLNSRDFQQIQTLLKSNDNAILHKWPPLQNQNLLREIKLYFKEHSIEVKNHQEIIAQHFDNIKAIIIDHIEDLKKQTLVKYNKLPELEEQFYNLYNLIAEKDKIKDILLQQDTNFDSVQAKFKEVLKEKEEQKQKNEEAILEIFNLYKQYASQLNEKKLNELAKKIIKTAKSTTYFPPIEDVINYSIEKLSDLQSEEQNFSTSTSLTPTVRTLLEMIKNPLNFFTEEFQYRIAEQIIQLTPNLHFDINQDNNENDQPIKLRKIDDKSIEMLLLLKDKMIEIEDYFKSSKVEEKILPFTKQRIDLLQGVQSYQELKNILRYLPVFELVHPKIKFSISYSQQQSSFQQSVVNTSTQFIKNDYSSWNNLISSDLFLNRNITYKVQFQTKLSSFNRQSCIQVGIFTNKEEILSKQKLCLELHSQNKYGIDVFKKGSYDDFQYQNQFELTVNLSEGQLEISDYPKFNNTVEVRSESKKILQESFDQFYIGFSVYYANDQIFINNIEQIKSK